MRDVGSELQQEGEEEKGKKEEKEEKEEEKEEKGEEALKARRAGTEASRLGQVRVGGWVGGFSRKRFRTKGVGRRQR